MITVDFLITSLIVVLIPGTGVVFTVSTGLLHGTRASVYASLGCTAGILPHLLAAVLGLAAVLHASAVAFQLLKFAGVLYLLYLAYATWRDKAAFAVDASAARPAGRAAALAEAAGLPISSHLFPEVSAHLLAASPTVHWLEYVDWAEPVLQQPLQFDNGDALIPDVPGTGIDWNEEQVQRHLVP